MSSLAQEKDCLVPVHLTEKIAAYIHAVLEAKMSETFQNTIIEGIISKKSE